MRGQQRLFEFAPCTRCKKTARAPAEPDFEKAISALKRITSMDPEVQQRAKVLREKVRL